jgi:exonuclease VII small subunit
MIALFHRINLNKVRSFATEDRITHIEVSIRLLETGELNLETEMKALKEMGWFGQPLL